MGDRHTLAQKLLNGYHSKVMELLIDYLQDEKICEKTERYVGQHNPSPARLNTTFEEQPGALPKQSHRHGSSLPHAAHRQDNPDAGHGLPTPSNSAGSVKSQGSSLTAPGVEKIWLLSCDDDQKEHLVISKCTPGRHNLIRDRTMYNRGFGGKQKRVNESVNVPGSQRSVNVSAAVDLTWRRPGELTTDEARFYVVPKALLDSDVALAADESMEHQFPSDVQEAASPQGRYQPGFVTVDESDPAIPPRAPTAPMYSYQPSFMQPQPEVQRTYDRMSAMQEAQRIRGHEPPAHSAQTAPAILGRPNHATMPIASQAATSGQLQVRGFWGTTPISISFNPEESGEQFFQAFLRWAKRRGRGSEVDRSRMILWLKANKEMSDDAAQDLSLDLDELENLWATTVAWIHENKSAQAPHLYATVQMIEMEDG